MMKGACDVLHLYITIGHLTNASNKYFMLDNGAVLKTVEWNKCYGAILKKVLRYIDSTYPALSKTIYASDRAIQNWIAGRNFPNSESSDLLYEDLRNKITAQKDNAQLIKIISKTMSDYGVDSDDIPVDTTDAASFTITCLKVCYVSVSASTGEH